MLRDLPYTKAYRQGEILIFKLSRKLSKRVLDSYGLERKPDNVIREGEKTGHEHKVEGNGQLSMFANDAEPESPPDEGIIEVGKEGATITHPEHKDIKLEEGTYAVKTQKEAKGKNGHSSVKD